MASFRTPTTTRSKAAARSTRVATVRSRSRATASAITPTPSASVLVVANHPNSPRAYSLTGRVTGSTSGETTWSSPKNEQVYDRGGGCYYGGKAHDLIPTRHRPGCASSPDWSRATSGPDPKVGLVSV